MSISTLNLADIDWLITDVHSLIASFSITNISLSPSCQLNCSDYSMSGTTRIEVKKIDIGATMTIDKMSSLLSQIDVDQLGFDADCKVTHMDRYKPRSAVSHWECTALRIEYIFLFFLLQNQSIY